MILRLGTGGDISGLAGRLRAAGAEFDDWPEVGPDVVRLVTAFNTRAEDVETFLSLATAG